MPGRLRDNKGFSIIETVVYLAIFSMVLIFIVSSIIYVGKAYFILKTERSLASSASASMDRIVREIRYASSVDAGGSVLGSSPGSMTLLPDGIYFFVDEGALKINEDGVVGALTSDEVEVTSLVFNRITTPNSEAVKVELELRVEIGEVPISKKFYSTAVLRGSY